MAWEQARPVVLVTDLEHEIVTLGQLYQGRADLVSHFDELKIL